MAGSDSLRGLPYALSDVLGVEARGATLLVSHCPLRVLGCCGSAGVRSLATRTVQCETVSASTALATAFWAHEAVALRPKRLLVLLNPCSGTGNAASVWKRLEVLLPLARARAEVVRTTHQLHATEVGAELEVSEYDAAVVVSGDGLLSEIYNGLRSNARPSARLLPLGVIPAGSGNALAKSVSHAANEACCPLNAALSILCCSHSIPLDAATARQPGAQPVRALLSLSWGIIADIDTESERLRCLGSARFTIQAVVRTARLRQYAGTLLFQPLNPATCVDGRDATSAEAQLAAETEEGVEPCGAWRALDGPFVSVWALNVPFGSETAHGAPSAVFADGCMDVVVMRSDSKADVASALISMDTGGHVHHNCVAVVKAQAFVLIPGAPIGGHPRKGLLVLDGERVAEAAEVSAAGRMHFSYLPIAMRIERGAARLLGRPPVLA